VNLTGPLKFLTGVGNVEARAVAPNRLLSFTNDVSIDPSWTFENKSDRFGYSTGGVTREGVVMGLGSPNLPDWFTIC
jgi:hypothetical protein